jgi:hypothetical protein
MASSTGNQDATDLAAPVELAAEQGDQRNELGRKAPVDDEVDQAQRLGQPNRRAQCDGHEQRRTEALAQDIPGQAVHGGGL